MNSDYKFLQEFRFLIKSNKFDSFTVKKYCASSISNLLGQDVYFLTVDFFVSKGSNQIRKFLEMKKFGSILEEVDLLFFDDRIQEEEFKFINGRVTKVDWSGDYMENEFTTVTVTFSFEGLI